MYIAVRNTTLQGWPQGPGGINTPPKKYTLTFSNNKYAFRQFISTITVVTVNSNSQKLGTYKHCIYTKIFLHLVSLFFASVPATPHYVVVCFWGRRLMGRANTNRRARGVCCVPQSVSATTENCWWKSWLFRLYFWRVLECFSVVFSRFVSRNAVFGMSVTRSGINDFYDLCIFVAITPQSRPMCTNKKGPKILSLAAVVAAPLSIWTRLVFLTK